MKKIILTGLLTIGLLSGATSTAFAGGTHAAEFRDCVITKAGADLDEGQMALLQAHGDGEINILSTAREHDLNPLDGARVHAIMWLAGTSCMLGG